MSETVAVHALVSSDLWWRFKSLAKLKRQTQSVLFRDALDALFHKYDKTSDFAFDSGDRRLETSLVMRIERDQQARLRALVGRSRIRQSEFVREALVDFLREAA